MSEPGNPSALAALANFRSHLLAALPPTQGARTGATMVFAAGLEGRVFQGAAPASSLLAQLRERITASLDCGEDRLPLSSVDWLDAPWLLFAGWRGQLFVSAPTFRQGLLTAAFAGPRVTFVARLIDGYLRYYDTRWPEEMCFLGETIIELLSVTRGSSSLAEEWWQRQREFRLFHPFAAPACLAGRMLAGEPETLTPFLERAGLGGALSGSGLSCRALLAFAEIAHTGPGHRQLETLDAWCALQPPREPAAEAECIAALLNPWRKKPMPSSWREKLAAWLEKRFGGLPARPRSWDHLDAETQAAWPRPPEANPLADYFGLLGELAHEQGREALATQVQIQQAFWQLYAGAGRMLEWRFAFGPAVIARFGYDSLQTRFGARFARLEGFRHDRCALLARFARLVVFADTHHAQCLCWPADSPGAPDLAQEVFYRVLLLRRPRTAQAFRSRGKPDDEVLSGGEYADWQRRVSEFIQRESGESLPNPDAPR